MLILLQCLASVQCPIRFVSSIRCSKFLNGPFPSLTFLHLAYALNSSGLICISGFVTRYPRVAFDMPSSFALEVRKCFLPDRSSLILIGLLVTELCNLAANPHDPPLMTRSRLFHFGIISLTLNVDWSGFLRSLICRLTAFWMWCAARVGVAEF